MLDKYLKKKDYNKYRMFLKRYYLNTCFTVSNMSIITFNIVVVIMKDRLKI